ncbi:MAG: transposase [Lentisphaerae bacterium]|nr:transposase [Lentisphaerota bacterium]
MGRILHLTTFVSSNAFHLTLRSVFPAYDRRRPEESVLYKTISGNIETFFADADRVAGKGIPNYVRKEFYEFLKCGILAHGFMRVQCDKCHHEKLVAFSCKRRGFCPSCGGRRMAETAAFLMDGVFPQVPIRQWVLSFPFPLRYLMAGNAKVQSAILALTQRVITRYLRKQAKALGEKSRIETGAVTLIQRFGGSINLNVHFHMLVMEGGYVIGEEEPRWVNLPPPTDEDVRAVVKSLSLRIIRYLTRKGYFEKSEDALRAGHDSFAEKEPVLATCMAASVTSQIGLGPRTGQKVRRLGTMEQCYHEEAQLNGSRCATLGGFSLHANTACGPKDRDHLEQLLRYVARPAIAMDRLSRRHDGLLVYKLKKPYQDGTEYLLFSPEELLEKLAALVPLPRVHLIRFHGALAPHAKIRAKVIPKHDVKNSPSTGHSSHAGRMSWAQLLQRVFHIDVETCGRCGGKTKIIAAILQPDAIREILTHLGLPTKPPTISPARAPP